MLLQFRDKNSGANIQLPTEQPVKPSKKKEIKTDYESDSRAGRMRDKARRNRSVDHLDRLDESHSRKKSKSRGRSSSRQRTSSKSRGRSSSKRRDSSSSSDRSVKKSRGRSKSRRKESSSSDDSRHKKGRGRSKSRRRSSSSDKKRSKSEKRKSTSQTRGRDRGRSSDTRRSRSEERSSVSYYKQATRPRPGPASSVASSYMPGYGQSDFRDALRTGMAVQMVKTKPRGWVNDPGRLRRHDRSPGRNDQASSYAASSYQGSTSEWAKHDTQYRLNQHVHQIPNNQMRRAQFAPHAQQRPPNPRR